jgi:hypothetical protein
MELAMDLDDSDWRPEDAEHDAPSSNTRNDFALDPRQHRVNQICAFLSARVVRCCMILQRFRVAFVVPAVVTMVGIGLTACTSRATTPGDFWIEYAEATQGTQLLQEVPLIANKRTFIRVSVRGNPDAAGVLPIVSVALFIEGVSSTDPSMALRPLNHEAITVPRSDGTTGVNATRWTLNDSFVFEMPPSATTAGRRRIALISFLANTSPPPPPIAGSTPGRKGLTVDLNFGPTGTTLDLPVYAVRYHYTNVPPTYQAAVGITDSIWPAHDWTALDRMLPLAQNLMPVASISFNRLPVEGEIDCRYVASPSGGIGGCSGVGDAQAWAARIVDGVWPDGGARIVVLQPESNSGHNSTHALTEAGNHVIMVQEDSTDTGLALARGLGLSAGLCDPRAVDCYYPRPNGALGPYTGLRYDPVISVVSGEEPLGTSAAFDLMDQSGEPRWISPYNYCRAMTALSQDRLACPGSLDHVLATTVP